MGWLWFAVVMMALFIFGIGYVLYRLIDKHYALEEKLDNRCEAMNAKYNQNFDIFDARVDTVIEDLEYLDKCFKEDSERAGLAFAKIENKIGRLGVRLQVIEDENKNASE